MVKTPGGGNYFIQVGAWKNTEAAEKMLKKLKGRYPAVYILHEKSYSKVRIPGITSKKQGEIILEGLKKNFGIEPILVLKTRQG